MSAIARETLRRLGSGESIDAVCQQHGWTRVEFDSRWREEIARRVPKWEGKVSLNVHNSVSIDRDRCGIPHIFADNHDDLWIGFGYAMAQDRLFQLDYLRRKGLGRLAEILGPDGVASDLVARTVGLNRIAAAELSRLDANTRQRLEAFSAGVNACIEHCGDTLPIEFDLLDYRPDPWTPLDCLAIENEFRWYLTGRFPVIVMPELAKRVLGDGVLYRELLLGEEDDEAVIPPEAYRDHRLEPGAEPWSGLVQKPNEAVGQATGDPERTGSNNWVVAGRHCRSGKPMVASDPHIAFEAVSCWYQAHLCGGDYNVTGMAYVGMPAILCGRNKHAAWGITNNICSQRDLYQERTDPGHPNCFLFDGQWEPSRELTETIAVKGSAPITRTIRFSRNGPVVDEILPSPGDQTGPVTLKWLGAYHGGWLTALINANRSRSVSEFRKALRPWHVPTFNVVVADVSGKIAVQSAGRIPLRKRAERGYRRGWDKDDQWIGLLPFEAMPHAIDPERGWLATANNRLAADDYPYPLFGTWPAGLRAARIRHMIEDVVSRTGQAQRPGFAWEDFRDMQHDTYSRRAMTCMPSLLQVLTSDPVAMNVYRVQSVVQYLRDWDFRVEADSVGAAIFNVFFGFWTKIVIEQHFSGATAELLVKQADAVASRLLLGDPHGWFGEGQRVAKISQALMLTVSYLSKLGPDVSSWRWGRLHQLPLKHVLSNRGDLGKLLDHGGGPVKGDAYTVCNTGGGPDWQANTGGGFRMIADLSTDRLLSVDGQSQSGHPGSKHYSDQLSNWHSGEYHVLPLDRAAVAELAVERLVLLGARCTGKPNDP